MPIEMLTYGALAARLDISAEAARAFARRLRLPRSLSDDGRALVTIDVGEIRHRRRASAGHAVQMDSLQAEIVQLASAVAVHRADFERERERADHLAAELARLTAETTSLKEETTSLKEETTSLKEVATRLEGELSALRCGVQQAPPSRLGRLAASLVEADRRACR